MNRDKVNIINFDLNKNETFIHKNQGDDNEFLLVKVVTINDNKEIKDFPQVLMNSVEGQKIIIDGFVNDNFLSREQEKIDFFVTFGTLKNKKNDVIIYFTKHKLEENDFMTICRDWDIKKIQKEINILSDEGDVIENYTL